MLNKILAKLENKNIAILGFGKEGKSTYNFLRRYFKEMPLTIIDQNENLLNENSFLQEDKNVKIITGVNYLENLGIYDYVVKTPGIKLKRDDEILLGEKIISQVGLALEFNSKNIIGITGTKGKSTTSSLLTEVLNNNNRDAILLGNVGKPIFDYIEQIKEDTILVIEASSCQLDLVKNSPHIAIILNLYQDHLNYHGSVENYHLAKLNIFKYQSEEDYEIYTSSCKNILEYLPKYKGKKIDIENIFEIKDNEIIYNNNKIFNIDSERHLLGEHNLSNIKFVLYVSILLGLNLENTLEAICNFKPLAHRMEFVCEIDGVKYYNDSIATIPMATINCVKALKDVDTLIFGGMDRGIDYDPLIKFFNESQISNFICMKDTGYKLSTEIKRGNIYKVSSMEEAVAIAKKVTKKICLLSPAASSYNEFKNFEEKGNKYKELVKGNK